MTEVTVENSEIFEARKVALALDLRLCGFLIACTVFACMLLQRSARTIKTRGRGARGYRDQTSYDMVLLQRMMNMR